MKKTLTDAANGLNKPRSGIQALPLRDVLITCLIINSLRRSMELTKFTLRQYVNVQIEEREGVNWYMFYVTEHKTGDKRKYKFANRDEKRTQN